MVSGFTISCTLRFEAVQVVKWIFKAYLVLLIGISICKYLLSNIFDVKGISYRGINTTLYVPVHVHDKGVFRSVNRVLSRVAQNVLFLIGTC